MKIKNTLAFLFMFIAYFAPTAIFAKDAPKSVWLNDYNEALAQAKSENKRVLIDFTGSDWCHYCKMMDEEVLSTPQFAEYASKNLVLLVADFPRSKQLPRDVAQRNEVLARVMHVQGYPTFVVLNSDGDELDRRNGYIHGGPENFIRFLKDSENAAAAK